MRRGRYRMLGRVKRNMRMLAAGAVLLFASPVFANDPDPESAPTVEMGRRVSIELKLELEDGTVSNFGGEPLVFEAGAHKLPPNLERELVGMKLHERRTIFLPAEKGYGPVRPELFRAVPLEHIPESARRVGATVIAADDAGAQRAVRVREVKQDEVVVDFNHPLAGQDLSFDILVVDIQ